MNGNNKGNMLISYLFEGSDEIKNIDTEYKMRADLINLVSEWKEKGYIKSFVIADDECIGKIGCSQSITKKNLERKYQKGFADGAKAVCSLILETLKDQKFEILDNKIENYEIALNTIIKNGQIKKQ